MPGEQIVAPIVNSADEVAALLRQAVGVVDTAGDVTTAVAPELRTTSQIVQTSGQAIESLQDTAQTTRTITSAAQKPHWLRRVASTLTWGGTDDVATGVGQTSSELGQAGQHVVRSGGGMLKTGQGLVKIGGAGTLATGGVIVAGTALDATGDAVNNAAGYGIPNAPPAGPQKGLVQNVKEFFVGGGGEENPLSGKGALMFGGIAALVGVVIAAVGSFSVPALLVAGAVVAAGAAGGAMFGGETAEQAVKDPQSLIPKVTPVKTQPAPSGVDEIESQKNLPPKPTATAGKGPQSSTGVTP